MCFVHRRRPRPAIAATTLSFCLLVAGTASTAAVTAAAGTASAAEAAETLEAGELGLRIGRVADLDRRLTQSLVQDANGYLWFGSTSGAFRYDGYELTAFHAGPDGLSADRVNDITVDTVDPNILWFATGDGLTRLELDTETFTHFKHDPDDPSSLGDNTLSAVVEDQRNPNHLWLATLTSGLNRFDKTTGEVVRHEHDPGDDNTVSYQETWRLLPDPADDDILWVGTWGGGLDRFDTATETWTHFPHDPDNPDDPSSLPATDNIVTSLVADADDPHTLWLGSFKDGLASFDTRTATFTHHPPTKTGTGLRDGAVAAIHDDGQGKLWIGSWIEDTGLTRLDKERGTFTTVVADPSRDEGLSSNAITQFFRDHSGILWVTHAAGAIDKIDPNLQGFRVLDAEDGLAGAVVQSILEDRRGDLWVGTTSGLSRIDRVSGSIANHLASPDDDTTLTSNNILDLHQASDGMILVSTFATGVIDVFDPDRGVVVDRYVTDSDSFKTMVEDPDDPNIVWLGVRNRGLGRLDRRTEEFTYFEPDPGDPDAITNLYVDVLVHDREHDIIWTGGVSGGLNRFDVEAGTFSHHRHDPGDPTTIGSDTIGSILQDESGALWVAAGGLNHFDPDTGRFERIDWWSQHPSGPVATNERTSSDVVAIEQASDGMLWLASGDRLVRFDPDERVIVGHYPSGSGVQRGTFNAGGSLRGSDGTLHFGGVAGITSFEPASITTNPHPPLVYITELAGGGEVLVPTDVDGERRLELSWREPSFDFEFVGLSYSQPDQTAYSFLLEGFDDEWSTPSTRRFSRYTNLGPGDYTLRVRAANADGVWTESDTTLRVVVDGPIWASWSFRVLGALVLMGALVAALWVRTRIVARRNHHLEAVVAKRTAELERAVAEAEQESDRANEANRAKTAFVRDMSHELGNPMTVILGYAELLQLDSSGRHDPQRLLAIEQGARHSLALLEETMDLTAIESGRRGTRPEPTNIDHLVDEVIVLLRPEAEAKKVELSSDVDSRLVDPVVMDNTMLRQVLLNLGKNAIAATSSGTVTVTATVTATATATAAAAATIDDAAEPTTGDLSHPTGEGRSVRFEVVDTGVGIAEDDLDRIFEPFAQASDRRSGGRGLGLSISSRLVVALGGELRVRSTIGSGSTFSFTIVEPTSCTPPEANEDEASNEANETGVGGSPSTTGR